MRNDYIMFDQAVVFDGKMYFFPAGIMTSGIFYNADMLAAAGMDRPGDTWAEILQQAQVEADARWMEEPGVNLVERQYRAP